MTPPQSYRVKIKDASALAILESLRAMQAIEIAPEPVTTATHERSALRSLRGSVSRRVSEEMLRHTEEARSEWGKYNP